jgi:hypothetical protein
MQVIKITLLSVNDWQLAGARCQQATVARDEFKKPVYESKFTKRAEGMSFINFKLVPSAPEKCHAGRAPAGSPKPPIFREVSEMPRYVKGIFLELGTSLITISHWVMSCF